MKELLVFYTGSWSTVLEVPDDFVPNSENILRIIDLGCADFDFSDGGAEWWLDSVQFDDESIDMMQGENDEL